MIGVEMMDVVTTKTRKWAAVMATLMTMLLAVSVALGEAPTQCEVAYLTSGPTAQQSSFEANCEHAI